jgi:hypothetical protein
MLLLRSGPSEVRRKELASLIERGKASAETKDAYKAFQTREKILGFMQDVQKGPRPASKEERDAKLAEIQAQALAKWKEGLVPAEAGREYINYLMWVVQGAITAKDKSAAEAALKPLKTLAEGNERFQKTLADLESQISTL